MKFSSGRALAFMVLSATGMACHRISSGQPVAEAELAFARDAQVRGLTNAFLSAFADSGLLFVPTPANAKAALQARPFPTDLVLLWTPAITETSAAGDLAISTGPVERSRKGSDQRGNGNYLTVWRKHGEQWLVEVDGGISRPFMAAVQVGGIAPVVRARQDGNRQQDEAAGRTGIVAAEQNVAAAYPASLAQHGAADLRAYRDGYVPSHTLEEARTVVAGDTALVWSTHKIGVSRSGDLGYVLGTVNTQPESGFLRIYRWENGRWWVAYDLR